MDCFKQFKASKQKLFSSSVCQNADKLVQSLLCVLSYLCCRVPITRTQKISNTVTVADSLVENNQSINSKTVKYVKSKCQNHLSSRDETTKILTLAKFCCL